MEQLLTLSEQSRGGISGSISVRDNTHPGSGTPALVLACDITSDVSGPNFSSQTVRVNAVLDLSEAKTRALHAILGEWLRKLDEHRKKIRSEGV